MKSLSTLATCNFGNFQFWQLAILATCNFGNLQFWQLTIWQLSILTTFSFDNFQFWLFSSKIFELIQQQEEHIDCMDLAIKNWKAPVIICIYCVTRQCFFLEAQQEAFLGGCIQKMGESLPTNYVHCTTTKY